MSADTARIFSPSLPRLVHGAVVTVGTFDGVHLGHRDLLERLTERAASRRLPSLLVTFDPHPLEVVNPSAAPPLLSTTGEKLQAIAESEVDYAVVLPFTPALAALDATAFVDRVLLERCCMRELLIGYDHGFGRGREGDVNLLRRLGDAQGFGVDVVEAVSVDGQAVSSSAVRRAVSYGDLERSARLLGRRYAFAGQVVRGQSRGRALGFPTLNIALSSARKLLPPTGVYAVLTQSRRGTFGGMMNLGPRPTFGDATLSLEVHLFDVGGDWYDEHVRVEFVRRLRETLRFDSVEALVGQLRRDEAAARDALTQLEV
jgi:riboflavin kinase/FMN adenylyltransferase